jgi:hypothetical protein
MFILRRDLSGPRRPIWTSSRDILAVSGRGRAERFAVRVVVERVDAARDNLAQTPSRSCARIERSLGVDLTR